MTIQNKLNRMNSISSRNPDSKLKPRPTQTATKPRHWTRWLAAVWCAGVLPALAIETSFLITKDTYLDSRSGSQESNYGLNNAVRVLVNSDTSVTRGLVAIPEALHAYQPGEILEAKVYLYVFQDNTKTRDIRLYPLTRSFVEGTGGDGATATGATWFTHDATNNWTSAGGDFDANHFVLGVKEPILDINLNDRFFSWDITGLLTNGLTRSNLVTHGAILIMDGENSPPASSSDRVPFTSSENLGNPVEFRPRLAVKLTPRAPILSLAVSNPGELFLSITNTMPYLSHRIERTYDLAAPIDWTEVTTLTVTGTQTNRVEAAPGAGTNVFYRVVIAP